MLADVHVATRQPKKSRILSPDRTAESQGGCANRPVVRFACVEPLPRFGFEIAIEVQAAASRARLLDLRNANAFVGSPPCCYADFRYRTLGIGRLSDSASSVNVDSGVVVTGG
jgi:hypothetical protein